MDDSSPKNLLSPAKKSGQLKRVAPPHTGVRTGVHTSVLALLSLAACTSSNDSPATGTPPTTTESVTFADSTVTDSLIYITPEGSLDGVDLAQIDLSSLVLEGSDGVSIIKLGDLDSSEVSIVTNSEGNQVFAVARSAANKHASSSTSSAPISYNLKATSAINFIDQQGTSQKIDVGDVITEDALTIDPALVSVIKELADVQGNTAQLAAITVDLGEVFTSVSAISFSAVDDEGNAIALTDKNRDGIAAEFSLDELAASFGESGTITVRAETAGGIFVGQSFSVVVMQEEVNTPFVGDGEVVTITNGNAKIASILALPLSGGDGEITYALEGNNKASAVLSILQGQMLFSADASGTYTLVATDADGDRATISIDYTIPNNEVSIANALAAQTHEGNDGAIEVNLGEVFAGGGDLTLTTDRGEITNNILTVDTSALADGDHTIRVTAKDSDGEMAIDTFVLTVDKSPTIVAAISDDMRATNHSNTTIDLTTVFANGSGTLTYAVTAPAGVNTANSALTIDYATLGVGTHSVTVTATDSDAQNADAITEVFVLEVVKLNDNSLGSNAPLLGTTYADAITGNSFAEAFNNLTAVVLDGDAGNDIISNNSFSADSFTYNNLRDIYAITLDGGDGNDTISNNSLSSRDDVYYVYLVGDAGNDTISGNTLTASDYVHSSNFSGGAGNDTISGNTLTAYDDIYSIYFNGGEGDDTISSNSLTARDNIHSTNLSGGAGDDTISSNTITAWDNVYLITFDGGDGNDTISDNHLETRGTRSHLDAYAITLMGGAGDDVFRNNTASQTNGELASLTIDGGDGEDTVVFRSIADEYAGLSDWTVGVTTITLTGDGAAVTLIDVETISFADGASYSAADAWAKGDEEVLYNLTNIFPDAENTVTTYKSDSGTITGNTLALAGTELGHGANTIVITATATDNNETTETTETITVNVVRDLEILIAMKQHNPMIFDLGDVLVETATTAYTALSLPDGVTLDNGNLIFDNTVLSIGVQPVVITATDGSDAVTHTLIYALDAIKDQTFSDRGSNTTFTGTTFADAITGNSFAEAFNNLTAVDLNGGAGNDTINNNSFTTDDLTQSYDRDIYAITFDGGAGNDMINGNILNALAGFYSVYSITFLGGDGDDTISNNTLTGDEAIYDITFDGGAGNDTISSNTLDLDYEDISAITFLGGDDNDTISNNTLTASWSVLSIAFDGGTGDDTISNNILAADHGVFRITFDGGDGSDTISGNTLTSGDDIYSITFDGGAGNDTISDNHFETSETRSGYNIYGVTLIGGAGDDVFRNNTAIQANGRLASLTIDGGDGEDTVEFGSFAGEYAGLSDWTVGVTTITLTGDGAAVTLIDVETISFADGSSYSAADAVVEGNGGTLYDLANVFPDANTYTYTADRGTIGNDSILTLAGTELVAGANTIVITATASDNAKTIKTITVNTVKTLEIVGAKQHAGQTIDLDAIFVDANTYTSNTPVGINLSGSTLTFDNTNPALTEGEHTITITATDASNVVVGTHTLTYDLDAIKDQTFSGGDGVGDSNITCTGTTYADAITGNSFSASTLSNLDFNLTNVDLDGGGGNDTINNNTLTANYNINSITFDGGDGDDTISNNTFTAVGNVFRITFDGGDGVDTISSNTLSAGDGATHITFDGGDGDDTISNNTLSAGDAATHITFDGGDGDDTISSNTLSAGEDVAAITFDGGIGNDTISDNHFESTGTLYYYDVFAVTLMGDTGDDVFGGNTATQANSGRASITIDGGTDTDGLDTDKVYFELASNLFTITGTYGSNITVTDNAKRTETANGVDSYAEYVLIDIEELYFSDSASKYEF